MNTTPENTEPQAAEPTPPQPPEGEGSAQAAGPGSGLAVTSLLLSRARAPEDEPRSWPGLLALVRPIAPIPMGSSPRRWDQMIAWLAFSAMLGLLIGVLTPLMNGKVRARAAAHQAQEVASAAAESASVVDLPVAPAPEPSVASPVVDVPVDILVQSEAPVAQTPPPGVVPVQSEPPVFSPARALVRLAPVPKAPAAYEALKEQVLMDTVPASQGEAAEGSGDVVLFEAVPTPTAAPVNSGKPLPRGRSRAKGSKADAPQTAASEPEARPQGPHVEGIFYDKVRPMAMIDGDIVEIGTSTKLGKVVDIQPGKVTLENGGVRRVLTP